MTLALLLILAAIAFLFTKFVSLRAGRAIYLGIASLSFLIGYGVPANLLLANLQDGYDTTVSKWGNRNLIILLGAGSVINDHHGIEAGFNSYGRIAKAIELYLACKQTSPVCHILITGGDPQHYGLSEAEAYAARMISLGVATVDIQVETKSKNTFQNAQFTATTVTHGAYDRTVLVTSGFHLRRSALCFSHFGMTPTLIRADYVRRESFVLPTAFNFMLMDLALHEYVGMCQYHIYNLIGWNVSPAKTGSP